ncbi:nuclear GTPase SLIP-GC-like [Coturnix japonica]|uniref:Nuclear GTPase SLIP-GC-like n=1 Tax=Coturnix japonica TaxID=93934 RepID=A0A8C2TPC7_COTJA|nr:nuclear GTPase SLIP-GC-like [Coturnix japonica]XP_015715300.1 nuclear GTPase SLIP-GC-like [Coturnix japonica]
MEGSHVEADSNGPFSVHGDRADVTPRKQPRLQLSFQQEEQMILRNYENIESKARKILGTSCQKMTHLFLMKDMPEHLAYLRDRITTLNSRPALEPLYIGLFGSSGAGKSTLLNTILGKRFFLPVSGTRTCTSCQVHVSVCRSKHYEAKIFLLSDEEWREEVKNLVMLLENRHENSEADGDLEHAIKVLKAVYGEGADEKSYEELVRTKPVIAIPPSRVITLRKTEADDLGNELDPYIRNQDGLEGAEEGDNSQRSEQMRLWPLIKQVHVTIPPSELVPEGVVFVDIPGIGDANKKRDEMWKESILQCTSIWIVADVERVFGAKAHEIMVKEAIKACQVGKCSDITFVITKIDKIDVDEYLRSHPGASRDVSNRDAILGTKQELKTRKTRTLREKMKRSLPSDAEILQKQDLVFPVSAKEYWDLTVLTREDTEINGLRAHVRKLYLDTKRSQLQDYMKEILVVFSLVDVYHSTQLNPNPVYKDELSTFMSEKIKTLKESTEVSFGLMDEPLINGVKSARNKYKKNIEKVFMQGKTSSGFHRTLKAVCVRKGVYVSRVFSRIDINNCLAEPIYAEIEATFAKIFRKQALTRFSLQASINKFSQEVKNKFEDLEKVTDLNRSKLNFLKQETDIIMRAIDREILLKKKTIYESLEVTIQSILSPCYEEAANIRGKDSCARIKATLMQNIELEVQRAMFEKAKEQMMSQFQNLTEEITTKLSKDFLSMLGITFCQNDQLMGALPDFKEECQEIQNMLRQLE